MSQIKMDETRLDKFERQLDTIVARLETLVRLEERHDGAVKRIDRQEQRLDGHTDRISALEVATRAHTASSNVYERAGWLVLSAIVGAIVYVVR